MKYIIQSRKSKFIYLSCSVFALTGDECETKCSSVMVGD